MPAGRPGAGALKSKEASGHRAEGVRQSQGRGFKEVMKGQIRVVSQTVDRTSPPPDIT